MELSPAQVRQALEDLGVVNPGHPMTIAVCDAAGDLLFLERDPGAPGFSADFAAAKAYTAARFNNSTSELEAAWADRPVFAASLLAQGKWFVGRGGEPIRQASVVIGGVGASGNTPDAEGSAARALAQALSS